jgi:putative ATP-binding protein
MAQKNQFGQVLAEGGKAPNDIPSLGGGLDASPSHDSVRGGIVKSGESKSDSGQVWASVEQPSEDLHRLFDAMVTKSYLQRLEYAEVQPLPAVEDLAKMDWVHISKLVYEQDTFLPDKLSMLYASLHRVASQVCLKIQYTKGKSVDLYLGARDGDSNNFHVSAKTMESALTGFLPGVEYDHSSGSHWDSQLQRAVASFSGVASLCDDKKQSFVQGIDRLLNAVMVSSVGSFSAIFIADRVEEEKVYRMLHAYEELSFGLSPLAEQQINFSESTSDGISRSITVGLNESIAKNIGETVTDGTNSSSSIGRSHTETKGTFRSHSFSAGLTIPLKKVRLNLGYNKTQGSSESVNIGTTETETQGTNHSLSIQSGETTSKGSHHDTSESISEQTTKGLSFQQTYNNRRVQSYLKTLDQQIERLTESLPFGLWSTAAYFVASTDIESQTLASIYRGSVIGETSGIEATAINLFPREGSNTAMVLSYLQQGLHPRFHLDGIDVSAGSIVTSQELAILFSLPQRSVPGILVQERTPFGRSVVSTKGQGKQDDYIELGCISHLGRLESRNKVRLALSELTKHTFVTGSTGSGKSNTLYLMLGQLLDKGIKMLVIEPAKGEYKHVFGHRSDVRVLGTNPKKTELLRLNPFVFPDDILVTEHIDQLVEIFNACWPMYAAMPAVLKASVENAYKACGWDLTTSENEYHLYPTMEDVLFALRSYVARSSYSEEVKSNYRGSLETRLESLTRGILGEIFTGRGAPSDAELFDSNVIIDLSRVGSIEVKALLMGILTLRLREYRIATATQMNMPLKHVTILEEAHNLLKRTSTEQSAEGANLVGKSVEMIVNGIAEMRTYGEGFIIVDQSPGMLDLSAIRNTNTKIVMALPEYLDRDAAGKSLGLTEKQILDISKQSVGQAIAYQSDWEEAVQCQIQKSQSTEIPFQYIPKPQCEIKLDLSIDVLRFLFNGLGGVQYRIDKGKVEKGILASPNLSATHKCLLLETLRRSNMLDIPLVHRKNLFLWYLGAEALSDFDAFANRQRVAIKQMLQNTSSILSRLLSL